MRTLLQIAMVLSLCIYTIPIEEWDMMSKPQKKERLKKGIEFIKSELGCKNPDIQLDIDTQHLYVYGECDKGKYIADKGLALSRLYIALGFGGDALGAEGDGQ